MDSAKSFWKRFSENWERVVFAALGLVLLGFSVRLIYSDNIPNSAVVFGLGFLSFIYANVSRFKRFKGLGFEAELWEDKKKEAAELIERLKTVVSIYTREVILGKVTAGRLGSGADWNSHWQLYKDLTEQHMVLGQQIDFSDVKKTMDDYFLFDMTMPLISDVRKIIDGGKVQAMRKIEQEFGSPIKDADGHGKRLAIYHAVESKINDPFKLSKKDDLAGHTLKVWQEGKARLKKDFDIDVDLELETLNRLEKISALYKHRPVLISEELIAWGNRQG